VVGGADRIDPSFTAAMMQGKFACEVVPDGGHWVHEHKGALVADKILTFLIRQGVLGGRKPPLLG